MVSLGSAAMYGGICNYNFLENFVPSLAVKELKKSINILQSY